MDRFSPHHRAECMNAYAINVLRYCILTLINFCWGKHPSFLINRRPLFRDRLSIFRNQSGNLPFSFCLRFFRSFSMVQHHRCSACPSLCTYSSINSLYYFISSVGNGSLNRGVFDRNFDARSVIDFLLHSTTSEYMTCNTCAL